MPDHPDSTPNFLFVALIVPDPQRRKALASAIAGSRRAVARAYADNPIPGDLSGLARLQCDVAIVDLDDDTEQALRVIENISRNPSKTVMAYSARSDLPLVRHAMQAGARDFLTHSMDPETVRMALDRISSRRTSQEKAPGKLFVFVPSKRGSGVTFVASNFAVALARESDARVAVVDMDLQLGDLALGLGITSSRSVVDALRNPARLDREFLSSLLNRHKSGLEVLASPEEYNPGPFPDRASATRMLQVLREEFDYVVVDIGNCDGEVQELLFETADKLYLVTERSFPALRNAQRLILCLSAGSGLRKLEVVLNERESTHSEIAESTLRKAIGRNVDWTVPHGQAAAARARTKGIPLAMERSPVTAVFVRMARAACGKPPAVEKTHRLLRFLDMKVRAQLTRS